MFISTELVLQTTRLFLVRVRPFLPFFLFPDSPSSSFSSQNHSAPPGLIASFLPLLSQFSPQLGLVITTALKYVDLLTTCLNDFAVLVFCIGVVVLVGRWKAGPPGLVEFVEEKTNQLLEKAVGEL
jgi:hypothetical protein